MMPLDLRETNLWAEDVAWPAFDPARPLPERVDLAIIGGGLTGLAAARALARRGAQVALLEAREPGWGASSRNGGMALTGLKLDVATLARKYGLDTARRLFAASLAALDCVEQIIAEERIACDFARCGHVLLAAKAAHVQALAAEAQALAQIFNHPTRLVPRGDLRAEIGSDIYYGGLVDEASAGLHPARYVAGLAQAALRAGAQIFAQTPVERIKRGRRGPYPYTVRTVRGTLTAREVFVASGAYTGKATPALRRKVFPLGSYIIATEVLPEALARELSPRGRMIFDSRHLLSYFRLTPDRRLLFGGRAAFFPETPATVRESALILRRAMLGVFPQLRDARVAYAWGGSIDATFDLMPHTGQANGLRYALGYAGHGVALATYLGTQVATQIAGDAGVDVFAEIPFPGAPLGLYNGRPWFLPFAGLWYRFMDWVG